VLYLLDADVLIRADRTFYPPGNFPTFWDWLAHMGNLGNVKIPREQYEEITTGTGPLVDWLKREDVKRSLLLNEDAVPALVADVTAIIHRVLSLQRCGSRASARYLFQLPVSQSCSG